MKQTAIEWLVEKIQQAKPTFKFDSLIREAKEMEKQQKIEFADEYADAVMGGCIKQAEQYYNDTYGK